MSNAALLSHSDAVSGLGITFSKDPCNNRHHSINENSTIADEYGYNYW